MVQDRLVDVNRVTPAAAVQRRKGPFAGSSLACPLQPRRRSLPRPSAIVRTPPPADVPRSPRLTALETRWRLRTNIRTIAPSRPTATTRIRRADCGLSLRNGLDIHEVISIGTGSPGYLERRRLSSDEELLTPD